MNLKTLLIATLLLVLVGGLYVFLTNTPTSETSIEPPRSTAPVDPTDPEEPATINTYIGATVPEAEAYARANGVPFRVVEEDGVPLPVSKDFREGRINATVENGIVTDYDVETSDPVATEPDSEQDSETDQSNYDVIIGMTLADAESWAESNNVPFRVGMLDGEALAVTMDFRPGRITASVENGVVVGYTIE